MTVSSYSLGSQEPSGAAAVPSATVTIGEIPIFAGTANDAVRSCLDIIRSGSGGRIATANLDFLALARKDPQLRADLAASTLVVADGMPVVWLGKLAGARDIQRIAGVDLVGELFAGRPGPPLRVAIYGSTALICDGAIEALHRRGDGARVVHVQNPPFRELSEEERLASLQSLAESSPDVVLVALGCPAQERLIAEWHPALPTAVWIGIGGTLDFYAGVRRRAPKVAQRFGMEWAVRLVQEPRRLGSRYILRDLPALVRIAPACIARRLTD